MHGPEVCFHPIDRSCHPRRAVTSALSGKQEARREKANPDSTLAQALAPCFLPPICYLSSEAAPQDTCFFILGFSGEPGEREAQGQTG